MTEDDYRAQLTKLGLKPNGQVTRWTAIYVSRDGEIVPVPLPEWQTPEQREETIKKLKVRLGLGLGSLN